MSFLHTHGKLFSRVGSVPPFTYISIQFIIDLFTHSMETFIPVVNQMLAEFRSLLRRSPIPLMSQRLTQLLAINMFAVFHTSLKGILIYCKTWLTFILIVCFNIQTQLMPRTAVPYFRNRQFKWRLQWSHYCWSALSIPLNNNNNSAPKLIPIKSVMTYPSYCRQSNCGPIGCPVKNSYGVPHPRHQTSNWSK